VPSLLHDLAYTIPVGFCIYMLVRVLGNVPPFKRLRSA